MGVRRPLSIATWVAGACIAMALPFLCVLAVVSQALQGLSRELPSPASLQQVAQAMELQLRLQHALALLQAEAQPQALMPALRSVHQALLTDATSPPGGAAQAEEWRRAMASETSSLALLTLTQRLLREGGARSAVLRQEAEQRERHLRQRLQGLQQLLLVTALAVLPLAALLGALLARHLQQGQRQLLQQVLSLARGRYYAAAAQVDGPQEWQRLGEQLERLRQRLAGREQEQSRFLRLIAHDLKTPLVSVREGSALLREDRLGPLSPRQREVVEILGESARDLEQLIGKLLTPQQGPVDAAPEWFDAAALVEEVANGHRLTLTARGVRLEQCLRAQRLHGQREALRAALDNLMANALRHAPGGTDVVVETALRNGMFELSVRDHGRGVPASERVRIFEPFVRGPVPAPEAVQGSGLGLAIVRDIASAHGGEVRVEDARPGARFCLRWPAPVA